MMTVHKTGHTGLNIDVACTDIAVVAQNVARGRGIGTR